MKKIVFLFSGLGTQFDSMGEELYLSDMSFRRHMDELDMIATVISGKSVLQEFYNRSSQSGSKDLFSSLSMLYMVQYSLAKIYMEKGVVPDELMGFSLGETVAASVSNVLDASDIITFFLSESQILDGLSFETETLFVYRSESYIRTHPEIFMDSQIICNYSSSHSIISIPKDEFKCLNDQLNKNGIISYRMPINIPFHTKWMSSVHGMLFPILKKLRMNKAEIPVFSTLAGHDFIQPSAEYFWDVICQRICFSEKLREISDDERIYVDCSPASTCSNYIKYNNISNKCFSSTIYKKSNHQKNNLNISKMINDIKKYQGKDC